MPKADLHFDLLEEYDEAMAAMEGYALRHAIYGFDRWLRNLAKYEGRIHVEVEEVRDRLRTETEGLHIWN